MPSPPIPLSFNSNPFPFLLLFLPVTLPSSSRLSYSCFPLPYLSTPFLFLSSAHLLLPRPSHCSLLPPLTSTSFLFTSCKSPHSSLSRLASSSFLSSSSSPAIQLHFPPYILAHSPPPPLSTNYILEFSPPFPPPDPRPPLPPPKSPPSDIPPSFLTASHSKRPTPLRSIPWRVPSSE